MSSGVRGDRQLHREIRHREQRIHPTYRLTSEIEREDLSLDRDHVIQRRVKHFPPTTLCGGGERKFQLLGSHIDCSGGDDSRGIAKADIESHRVIQKIPSQGS